MEQQWGLYPRNEYDAAGIELGEVTDVKISKVDMSFKSRPNHGGTVGICIALDIGTHNVVARDVTCKGAWGGALVTLDSIGNIQVSPAELSDTISNIFISNLTFDGDSATGFKSGWHDSTMKNITWDGVTIINGNPASEGLCWLKSHSSTPYYPECRRRMAAKVTDIGFKRFRGKLDTNPPATGWGYINNLTVTEYHFEDWQSSTVV